MSTALQSARISYEASLAATEAIWRKLPPFNFGQAQAGKPYIHRHDVQSQRHYRLAGRIEGEHAATLIWAGEWLVYEDDCEPSDLERDFRMYDPAAWKEAL
jgi:hypothetical protein